MDCPERAWHAGPGAGSRLAPWQDFREQTTSKAIEMYKLALQAPGDYPSAPFGPEIAGIKTGP